MNDRETEARWGRLTALLAPIHLQAAATARRLSRSAADGDDLYQESVLRAFEKLHTLRDERSFAAWFYATLLSRHRSRSRRRFWSRFLAVDELPAESQPAGEDGRRWAGEMAQAARAARALDSLPAEQREAVVLFELEGYSIEEIAKLERVSVAAVKSRLVRGREKLRRFYERQGWGSQPVSQTAAAAPGPRAGAQRRETGAAS
jgi:RNA polymerase sigma-70 factor (ECF subfamily)